MQNNTKADFKIAFIGGGNMASALIAQLVQSTIAPKDLYVVDLNQDILDALQKQYGVQTSLTIDQQLAKVDVIVLAVKPQHLFEVAQTLKPFLSHQLLLSVAAGIRTNDLSRWLGSYGNIIRAMPNTPAMIGQGMSGLYAMIGLAEKNKNIAQTIMQAVGQTIWVDDENMIDAVTAVSGSGPAYVFYFIEAMQAAAMQLGFTQEQAVLLSKATFQGAAQMAMQSNDAVSLLRERVTSKGGTTYAALSSMQQSEIASLIEKAIHAAAHRGKELGDELGNVDKNKIL